MISRTFLNGTLQWNLHPPCAFEPTIDIRSHFFDLGLMLRAGNKIIHLILILAFLPLHILDVFKEDRAIGSNDAAVIRLQFV